MPLNADGERLPGAPASSSTGAGAEGALGGEGDLRGAARPARMQDVLSSTRLHFSFCCGSEGGVAGHHEVEAEGTVLPPSDSASPGASPAFHQWRGSPSWASSETGQPRGFFPRPTDTAHSHGPQRTVTWLNSKHGRWEAWSGAFGADRQIAESPPCPGCSLTRSVTPLGRLG